MVLAIMKVCFRFWDIWPENGDPMLLTLLVTHSSAMVYLLTTCGIMFGSMMADLMDEQELATGRRQEGVFSAAISLSAKTTSSLGLIIGGFLLLVARKQLLRMSPYDVLATKLILLFQLLIMLQAVESALVEIMCLILRSGEW